MDNDYNSEPVIYCKHCLSLKIKEAEVVEGVSADYCEDCGSTDMESSSIEDWDKKYYEMYWYHYLDDDKTKADKAEMKKDYEKWKKIDQK